MGSKETRAPGPHHNLSLVHGFFTLGPEETVVIKLMRSESDQG